MCDDLGQPIAWCIADQETEIVEVVSKEHQEQVTTINSLCTGDISRQEPL